MCVREAGGHAGGVRLGDHAIVGKTAFAIRAKPAGNVEREYDVFADLDGVDAITDLDDLAHILVAKRAANREIGAPSVQVQI